MKKTFAEYVNELYSNLDSDSNEFAQLDLGDFSEKLLKIYSARNSTNAYELVKKYLIDLSNSFEKILKAEFDEKTNSKTTQFVLVLPVKSVPNLQKENLRNADLIQLDSASLMSILKLIYKILDSSESLNKEDVEYLEKTKEGITKFRQMFRSQFTRIKKIASTCKIDIENCY